MNERRNFFYVIITIFSVKKDIRDENPTPEIGNLPTFSDAFLAVSAGPTAFFVLKSNFIFLILVRSL